MLSNKSVTEAFLLGEGLEEKRRAEAGTEEGGALLGRAVYAILSETGHLARGQSPQGAY